MVKCFTLMAWNAAPGIVVSPEYDSDTWRSTASFDSTKRGKRRDDDVIEPPRDDLLRRVPCVVEDDDGDTPNTPQIIRCDTTAVCRPLALMPPPLRADAFPVCCCLEEGDMLMRPSVQKHGGSTGQSADALEGGGTMAPVVVGVVTAESTT